MTAPADDLNFPKRVAPPIEPGCDERREMAPPTLRMDNRIHQPQEEHLFRPAPRAIDCDTAQRKASPPICRGLFRAYVPPDHVAFVVVILGDVDRSTLIGVEL